MGPIALSPTYNVAGCALVTSNGYAGTDRRLFIPSADGYYSIKDYTPGASSFWLITVEAFDPTQRLVDQALAVSPSYGNGSYPAQGSLSAGGRYYAWAAFGGGYGGVGGCQSDGSTETVNLRIVGEDSGLPSPPTGISASPMMAAPASVSRRAPPMAASSPIISTALMALRGSHLRRSARQMVVAQFPYLVLPMA